MRNCMAFRPRRNYRRVRDCRLPCLDTISRRLTAGSRPGSAFWFVVKNARRPAPLHLLLFGETLADDGVHGGLDECRGYPLTRPVALAVIDQARAVLRSPVSVTRIITKADER